MERTFPLTCILISVLFLSVSGNGQWNSFRGDPQNSGSTGDQSIDVMDLEQEWEFAADAGIVGSVLGNDERIYFNTVNGSTYAVDTREGTLLYKRQVFGKFHNSPLLDQMKDILVTASSSGEVTAYSTEDGIREWNITVGKGAQIRSSPQTFMGRIVITSYDSNVYCLDAASGSLVWTFRGCGGQIHTTPSFLSTDSAEIVFIGSCDGDLYALDLDNGSLVWNFSADYIPSSPAVFGQTVFFGSFDHRLYCLDAKTGDEFWSRDIEAPIFSSPSVNGSYVSICTDDGKLHLLERETGEEVFNISVTEGSLSTSPVMVDDLVCVTSDKGLRIYRLDNGSLARGFELGDASDSSPSAIGTRILFGDGQGYVHCLSHSEDEGEEPLVIGREEEPRRDLLVFLVGAVSFIVFGAVVYIGYLRIRRDQ